MTKLNKVIRFVRRDNNGVFSWKEFCKKMKCTYPCAETNYLSMLVKAQYVQRNGRGWYQVNITPGHGMSYRQLKEESQGNYV